MVDLVCVEDTENGTGAPLWAIILAFLTLANNLTAIVMSHPLVPAMLWCPFGWLSTSCWFLPPFQRRISAEVVRFPDYTEGDAAPTWKDELFWRKLRKKNKTYKQRKNLVLIWFCLIGDTNHLGEYWSRYLHPRRWYKRWRDCDVCLWATRPMWRP